MFYGILNSVTDMEEGEAVEGGGGEGVMVEQQVQASGDLVMVRCDVCVCVCVHIACTLIPMAFGEVLITHEC